MKPIRECQHSFLIVSGDSKCTSEGSRHSAISKRASAMKSILWPTGRSTAYGNSAKTLARWVEVPGTKAPIRCALAAQQYESRFFVDSADLKGVPGLQAPDEKAHPLPSGVSQVRYSNSPKCPRPSFDWKYVIGNVNVYRGVYREGFRRTRHDRASTSDTRIVDGKRSILTPSRTRQRRSVRR